MGDRPGSSPGDRTKISVNSLRVSLPIFLFFCHESNESV